MTENTNRGKNEWKKNWYVEERVRNKRKKTEQTEKKRMKGRSFFTLLFSVCSVFFRLFRNLYFASSLHAP
ncbi:MAG: hypothetical protein L0Y75_10260, partial [Acidobacteria bacterium]|nr:hypothetical protein [Acidobacteriota bacterium]